MVLVGELGLDGRLRPVPGVLPSIAGAAAVGFGHAVVPLDNAAEAVLVPAMEVVSAPSLGALVGWLRASLPPWRRGQRCRCWSPGQG